MFYFLFVCLSVSLPLLTVGQLISPDFCDPWELYISDTLFHECIDNGGLNMTTYNSTEQCLNRANHTAAQRAANLCIFNNTVNCNGTQTLEEYFFHQPDDIAGFNLTLDIAYEMSCELDSPSGCNVNETCRLKNVTNVTYDPSRDFFDQIPDVVQFMLKHCSAIDCAGNFSESCPLFSGVFKVVYMNEMLRASPDATDLSLTERLKFHVLIQTVCKKSADILNQYDCIKTQMNSTGFKDCISPYENKIASSEPTQCSAFNGALDCLNSHVGANCIPDAVDGVIMATRILDRSIPDDCPVGVASVQVLSGSLLFMVFTITVFVNFV